MPFPFSDWMPWWLQLALLIGGALFAFVWLLMPFAVFGLKGRLDAIALQLEDLQAELRVLALPPEDRRSAMPAPPRAAPAPVVEPVPVPARPAEPPVGGRASGAYAPRPERPAAPRPTRFDPPPVPEAPRTPPVEPPPATPPRPVIRAPLDDARPMPWHDRPVAPPREPPPPARPAPPVERAPMADRGVDPRHAEPRPIDSRQIGREAVDRARADDEWAARRPRSEPTLRWPPRP
ncbi:hypothetical protein JUN65_12410 [Gluconacetobacter azotocaptans]|uniref:hypothetical protein n=1 Tax=Gluconacetobacter azotocaptans TaxID=142834 RepID=UPI001959C963|nr:hypothetical protein [Gluconacetobacter azotocaptans]MBM9402385.1 hypothetical protein [Gluconacetobacter azotocaptans]